MCTYSMIADSFISKHPIPGYMPGTISGWPGTELRLPVPSTVSIEEFEQLKKEVAALKELLKAAKKFDAETGQPDCEMEEKVDLLRKIAKMVGVDLEEVLTK